MRSEGRQKIVIVGGGPAGLAAAFELTKPGLYPGECVTVYQIGWRLGGKCASGRDDRMRVVEHGLHLWFGYYENAFRLLREVYEELPTKPRRFPSWSDAFQPQKSTQIGDQRIGKNGFIPFFWPTRKGSPGDGRQPQLWDSLIGVLEILSQVHDAFAVTTPPEHGTVSVHPDQGLAFDSLFSSRGALDNVSPRDAIRCAHQWSTKIRPGRSDPIHLIGLKALLKATAIALSEQSRQHVRTTANDKLLSEATDIAAAFVSGIIDDVVFRRMEVVELDESDFCDWLVANGADRSTANSSPLVNALYDLMFQYYEGRTERPSYGAGTAAQVILRILGTYKGEAVWKPNAGLGEVFVAPLYEVLKARGVRFVFFHKLEEIELTEDRSAVARLRFSRQADLPEEGFEPTFAYEGLTCWPETPAIQRGVGSPDSNLESRWCDARVKPDLVLNHGSDFSDVILAIPPGAFRPLGGDPGPCAELVRASPRFRAMAENVGLVPSLSAQVWSKKLLPDLTGPIPATAMVSGPPALQIWADMSQTLECEPKGPNTPKSLYYFCNVFGSRPSSDTETAGHASKAARALAIDWFEKYTPAFWPKATSANGRDFDWDTFEDPRNQKGPDRLDAQVVKANVDPVACCSGSAACSTGWRLKTDASGFRHLYLAGAWIDTGFNTECIEAAVMSGKQASRAICGSPAIVEGEHFMRPGKSTGFGDFNLARKALALFAVARS